jgi:hypothetical protein
MPGAWVRLLVLPVLLAAVWRRAPGVAAWPPGVAAWPPGAMA